MKKKMILSIAFLISLLPMLFNQYDGLKGVQEITSLINLLNPIGMVSVILFVLGVWFPFKKRGISKGLGALGTIGIVVSEIYKFLTWHTLTVTGEVSLQNSIRLAFPEFYIFKIDKKGLYNFFVENKGPGKITVEYTYSF